MVALLFEGAQDVSCSSRRDSPTMLAILGATTLVLVAGSPLMLPTAPGEREGVSTYFGGGHEAGLQWEPRRLGGDGEGTATSLGSLRPPVPRWLGV